MRQNGWSQRKIGLYYGITESAISQLVDRTTIPRAKYEKTSQTELNVILNYLLSGLTPGQIAIKLDKPRQEVRNRVNYYTRQAKVGKGPWAGKLPLK